MDLTAFYHDHPLILAPMAGVTDEAFRQICLELGANLTYSEMVSAKGLEYANEKTGHLLDLAPNEHFIAVQLFGSEPAIMASQAAAVEDRLGESLAYIDINMGCPVRKVTKKGEGSALMDDPAKAGLIVSAIAQAIRHPVTVKIRRGRRMGEETCVEFAKALEAAGASAVAVHGRFAEQMYAGRADWDAIARVKQALTIPVVGNGDVRCGKDAQALVDRTACDAVMIGRAAQGNPWVFAEIAAYRAGHAYAPPTVHDKMEVARRHALLLSQRSGRNIVRMRKHAMWYMSGLPEASRFRAHCNDCMYLDDFLAMFDDIEETCQRYELQS